MVPGTLFVSLGPMTATSTVAMPMARLRQSQAQGDINAVHQPASTGAPTNFGIWLPMMINPTPER